MANARDIMHSGATCIGEHETLQQAARHMRDRDIGALPVCGQDDRLRGIITDRDIVMKCVATGGDPRAMTAGELAEGVPFHIDAGADVDEVITVMRANQIRRLPVMDNRRLVGMITEADLARHLSDDALGRFVEAIRAAA
ncbi:MAG TPA: CBS domain-containing protein [Stackebrandtia sp.]|jgi:CBS domain-containing protein|uniref:CBS domain-containing protein n=1 Tax=Stackebrandtia sp. TaxID=2023065 RepID=UPI002D551A72|nr:CBS domain-containing protein [Stackebrandtia sp.]HZE39150.1 CBS domain-containing protein [Stackebrandtia sp.]